MEQRRVALVLSGEQVEARGQSSALFARMEQRAVECGQPAPGALHRFVKRGALRQPRRHDGQRCAEGARGGRAVLEFDGLRQTQAGRRELAELLIQFRALGKLPRGDRHVRRRRAGRSGAQLIEPGLEVLLALQPDNLIHDLAVLEEQQRRDGVDAKLDREVLMVVNVDLADLHLAVVLGSQFVENRRDHLARAAPLGPEINEDGLGGLDHFLVKVVGGQRDDVGSCH